MKEKFKVLIEILPLYRILYEAIVRLDLYKKIEINLLNRAVGIRGLRIVGFNFAPNCPEYILIVYK
jgi:hypothetical protein